MAIKAIPISGTYNIEERQLLYPGGNLYFEADTSSEPCNIYLPPIRSAYGINIFITDSGLSASKNPINIIAPADHTISGMSYASINVNGGSGKVVVAGTDNYIFTSSSNDTPIAIITIDDGSTKALPFFTVLAEGQVATILTQIKAVADTGEIFAHLIRRTVKGVLSNPPGIIAPVGTFQEIGVPDTEGVFTFGINTTLTNNTGFIYFDGQVGKIVTITINEIHC